MLSLNAGALAAAVAFALASGAGGRTSHLCLATLAGYLVIVHSTVLLTGLVGHLSMPVLTGGGWVVFLASACGGCVGPPSGSPPGCPGSRGGAPPRGGGRVDPPTTPRRSSRHWPRR